MPRFSPRSVNPVSLLEFALERIGPALPSLFSLLAGGKIIRARTVTLDPEIEEPFLGWTELPHQP